MNSYTAEFGRNTGPQINVVTKSGGQRYSGSLSTYIRHEPQFQHARQRAPGTAEADCAYYTGVGTFGGPVALPGAGKLKRTFFYTREMWNTSRRPRRTPSRCRRRRNALAISRRPHRRTARRSSFGTRCAAAPAARPRAARRAFRATSSLPIASTPRPRVPEHLPAAELLRHQRQQPPIQLRRHRRSEGTGRSTR